MLDNYKYTMDYMAGTTNKSYYVKNTNLYIYISFDNKLVSSWSNNLYAIFDNKYELKI